MSEKKVEKKNKTKRDKQVGDVVRGQSAFNAVPRVVTRISLKPVGVVGPVGTSQTVVDVLKRSHLTFLSFVSFFFFFFSSEEKEKEEDKHSSGETWACTVQKTQRASTKTAIKEERILSKNGTSRAKSPR